MSDLQFLNSEPRYTNCELNFVKEIWPGRYVRTAWRHDNWLQMGSIWGQNELLEGLRRRLWDQQPGLVSSKWSQGRLPQFRPRILGSFWTSFWKIFEIHTALKDDVCFRCVFGSETWSKFHEFWFQIRTKWGWHLTISSEMRKVDFWTTVHVFWRILAFS